MIRVLLADDHAIVREGLKQLLTFTPTIASVVEAGSGEEVFSVLESCALLDILVLDLSMPGISGNELILRVRREYPDLPILVLSMHHEPQIAHHALKAGAAGYLTKDSDPETLIAAIHKVADGGRFIDASLAEAIAFESSMPTPAARHERLTERELAIMRLLAQGHGINAIAQALDISNKTVSTHKSRLMEKMGFHSVADLVRYTVSNGLRV